LTQDQININARVFMECVCITNLLPGWLKDALQAAQQSERQDDLAKVGVLEVPPKVFSILPNEIC
jgi:hypothetical protein